MTSAIKQSAIQAGIAFLNFRRSIGALSVKRNDVQAVADFACGLQRIVLSKQELEAMALAVGGNYITSTGGNSKFVF
jgi:hypothetical protein